MRSRMLVFVCVLCAFAAYSVPADSLPDNTIPGSYIVVCETGAAGITAATVDVFAAQVARDLGGQVKHVYRHGLVGFSIVFPPGQGNAALLKGYPGVKSVEPDRLLFICAQTLPTGVDRMDADLSDIAKIDGVDDRVDVDVAILDTGIDLDHPELNVVEGHDFTGTNNTGDDDHGHGSHVAGIVAALDNGDGVVGVAPGARLYALKVLQANGSGALSDIIAGVDWVTSNAATIDVANMSLGGVASSSSLHSAIAASVAAGVVYVVAAGNSSMDIYGNDGVYGGGDDFIPAAYPEVCTVSALADADGQPGGTGGSTSYGPDDTMATFSNYAASYGSEVWISSPGGAIDLAAPGVDIYSTYKDGGYQTESGTSMAAPHVAGAVALYIARFGRDADGDGDTDADDVKLIRQRMVDYFSQPQSEWGPSNTADPDDNHEPMCKADVMQYPQLTLSVPSPVVENDGLLSGAGTVGVRFPVTYDVTVNLTSSDPVVSLPSPTVTIPAGQLSVPFDLQINSGITGMVTVTVTATDQAGQSQQASAQMDVYDYDQRVILNVPSSVTEGDGTVSVSVTVADAPLAADLIINLSSSDTTEITVPATVTLPAGQASVSFGMTVVDDALIDGTQTVTVTATAPNRGPDSASVDVADNENNDLTVELPASATENDGILVGAGKVSISGAYVEDVTVSLTSSDTTELQVPATVTIPAGATFVNFDLTVMDDTVADGDQTVTVTASAPLWNSGQDTMVIEDVPPPFLNYIELYDPTSGDRTYTNDLSVGVHIDTSGFSPTAQPAPPTHMRFAETLEALQNAQWFPYAQDTTYTLLAGDGTRTLWCQLRNDEGYSDPASDTIIVDTTRPNVVWIAPDDGAQYQPVDATIQASFDDDMIPSSFTSENCLVTGEVSGDHPTSPVYDASSRTVTFNQQGDFVLGEKVTVTVKASVQDKAGNMMEKAYKWSFSITPTTQPPVLSDVLLFDRDSMNAELTNDSVVLVRLGASNAPLTMRYATSAVALSGAPWMKYSSSFYADLGAGDGVKHLFVQLGNPYGFSDVVEATITLDSVRPSVSSVFPADGAVDQPVDVKVRAVFSEDIVPATVTESNFSVKGSESGGHMVSPVYYPDTRTVEFNVSGDFTGGEDVTCTISYRVSDPAGNTLEKDFSWTFTVVQSEAPSTGGGDQQQTVDTDGDGMPDSWENANGLDPNDPSDASADPDNDGATNLEEYQAGTDPLDSNLVYAEGPFKSDGNCFIATAAFGSPAAGVVPAYRRFRDTMLLCAPSGGAFVCTYYAAGPDAAGLIRPRDALRGVVRRLLTLP